MGLILQNIESELSYAYLHAVAGKAGMSCKIGDRHDDAAGVDAEVNFRGVTDHPYIRHVQLNVQLKATKKSPGTNPEFVSYFFKGIERFNKLRTNDSSIYKILIVLFLPENTEAWLKCTEEELTIKNCAYWVSLYGADESTNGSGETVYLPRPHLINPDELIRVAHLAAHRDIPKYKRPS